MATAEAANFFRHARLGAAEEPILRLCLCRAAEHAARSVRFDAAAAGTKPQLERLARKLRHACERAGVPALDQPLRDLRSAAACACPAASATAAGVFPSARARGSAPPPSSASITATLPHCAAR